MRSPTKDEWITLEPVLEAALDLPREAARAMVAQACGDDRGLAQWAERFLDGAIDDFPVALSPEVVAGAMAHSESTTHGDGERIGPYHLVRQIGEGGMGAVYLAERADGQFEQRVALKMGHRARGDHEGRERFLRERQILARLEHPNISRLIDGGISDDGQPGFAMEDGEGEPLDSGCDRRELGIEELLSLLLSVWAAVLGALRSVVGRLRLQYNLLVGALLPLLLIGAACLSLVWTPWSAFEIDMAAKLQGPTRQHWLGTDPFGRDVASLLLMGARNSILVGVIAVSIGLLLGTAAGLLAAARRCCVDELVMRLAELTFAFPAILSAILLTP